MNTYRCRFSIDTQQVPGGCPKPADQPDEETTTGSGSTEVTVSDCIESTYFWCLLPDGSWRVKNPNVPAGICGELEVWENKPAVEEPGCLPYIGLGRYSWDPGYAEAEMAIWPFHCGPGPSDVTHGRSDIQAYSHFIVSLSITGACNHITELSEWYYSGRDYFSSEGVWFECNERDIWLNRVEDVCVPPDTDAASLKPWQYRATRDDEPPSDNPEVRKPYLWHDVPLVEEYCSRYPQARMCRELSNE